MTGAIPAVVPPAPRTQRWARNLPPSAAFGWLGAGWHDFAAQPGPSLAYGALIFVVSLLFVGVLLAFGWDFILFPAFAGFLVVGPLLALGLYDKSRRRAMGELVSLRQMILVRPRAGAQIVFTGMLLCLLVLLWMRSAVIIYALFFGLRPFPGLDHIAAMLLTTPTGWAMLAVGSAVGGLFAAFAFAVSVFSIPMLLDENVDALTAMGSSTAFAWHNLPVMIVWGVIVLALFLLGIATGLVGMLVIFPVLGHGSWHAYRAIRA